MSYQPPFRLTNRMTTFVADIAELIGMWKATNRNTLVPELRRGNRIRTIQASLAVEQNTLTLEQVTAVLAGKTVLGNPREIQEVQNAFAAYEAMSKWKPHSLENLVQAHGILMRGLADDAGQWRHLGVGIYREEQLVHMAPPSSQLSRLMAALLNWIKVTDTHPLIASAAFHYEFEFIHPFSDGNGRMGRLWQTLILSQWQPILAYLPVETVIKHRQPEYYHLLSEADTNSDCSTFIEFLLQAIKDSLHEAIGQQAYTEKQNKTLVETRVKTLVETRVKTLEQILILLQNQPELTLAEVAKAIGRSTSAVERAVAKLKQQNKLSHNGPKKGGHWQVHRS